MQTLARRVSVIGALSMSFCGLSSASGAGLAIGGTLFPAPGEADPTGGAVIFTTGTLPFVAPTFTGTLESAVISGDPSNPFGGLTFAYLLSNGAGSPNDIGRLTVVDFTGWMTDASWQTGSALAPLPPGGGFAPALIDRSTPDVVGFSFLGVLGLTTLKPGATSTWMVVQTNAPAWVPTMASVIDGSVIMVPSVGPAIPEPATLTLLGLGTCILLRRRAPA
jgi:hypothetical protein